jgi:hypothetical protein
MSRAERVKLPDWIRRRVAWRQDWNCVDCAKMLDWAFEVDHRVPLAQGGTNAEDNLAACCACCHARKSIEERSPWCPRCVERVDACRCAPVLDFEWARMSRVCRSCGDTVSSYFDHTCAAQKSSASKSAGEGECS